MPSQLGVPTSRRQIIYGCDQCGRWLTGPWRSRYAEDVPIEEVQAEFARRSGRRSDPPGRYEPAPRREGGMMYRPGGEDWYSGTVCTQCATAEHAQLGQRTGDLLARLRAPEPSAQEEEKPEPTEEEARRFLMPEPSAEEES